MPEQRDSFRRYPVSKGESRDESMGDQTRQVIAGSVPVSQDYSNRSTRQISLIHK